MSAQTRRSISKAKTEWHKVHDISGEKNPMFGKTHSEKVKLASKERAILHGFIGNRKGKEPWNKGLTTGPRGPNKKKKIKVQCSRCGIFVAKHILTRFHSDNCKLAVKNNLIS